MRSTLTHISQKLLQHATRINIIVGVVIILIVNFALFPYFSDYKMILDTHFGFDSDTVLHNLALMGSAGRSQYLYTTLFIDVPYAMIYGFVYAFIIVKLAGENYMGRVKFLIFLPFFISFFDLLEDAGIVYFLLKYPALNNTLINVVSFCNRLKWIFAFLTLLAVIYLVFMRLFPKKVG